MNNFDQGRLKLLFTYQSPNELTQKKYIITQWKIRHLCFYFWVYKGNLLHMCTLPNPTPPITSTVVGKVKETSTTLKMWFVWSGHMVTTLLDKALEVLGASFSSSWRYPRGIDWSLMSVSILQFEKYFPYIMHYFPILLVNPPPFI